MPSLSFPGWNALYELSRALLLKSGTICHLGDLIL